MIIEMDKEDALHICHIFGAESSTAEDEPA